MLVPSQALPKLICSACQNYLSIFPIYAYGDGAVFTCGRCPQKEELIPHRQVVYENLAENLKFPCRYKRNGCIENLEPRSLELHEDYCHHKPFTCTYLPRGDCNWEGKSHDLHEHYQECHNALVLKNLQHEIDLVNNYEENRVFIYDNETFIVPIVCNTLKNQFCMSIKHCGPQYVTEKYSFKLILRNDKNDIYEFPVYNVEILNSAKNKLVISADINDIKLNLHDPIYILCDIEMMKTVKKKEQMKIEFSEYEEVMLRSIECPVCLQYMVPPIMLCTQGHSFCGPCLKDLNYCPTCRCPIGNIRNYSLESLLTNFKYPCKHRAYGCSYTSVSTVLRKHEENCTFGPYSCPIECCNWKNKMGLLLEHIQNSHPDEFLDVDHVTYILTPGMQESICYITSSHDNIFKLWFFYQPDKFYWALQLVGPPEDSLKYTLELDIQGEINDRIFIMKGCGQITSVDEALDEGNPYIELSGHMLKNMINDDLLTYRFRIIKES